MLVTQKVLQAGQWGKLDINCSLLMTYVVKYSFPHFVDNLRKNKIRNHIKHGCGFCFSRLRVNGYSYLKLLHDGVNLSPPSAFLWVCVAPAAFVVRNSVIHGSHNYFFDF